MTKEEIAISLLAQVNKILVNNNSWLENTHEPLNIAFDMAIKAIKQKDAIEKIRVEVKDINPWALEYAPSEDRDIRPQIVTNVKSHVLEIIDKYRTDKDGEE